MSGHRQFPEELFRPELGWMVLPRTPTMLNLEAKWRGRALVTTVGGRRPPLSTEVVLAALVRYCGVTSPDVKVDVSAPPVDFFIRFRSEEECTAVLRLSGHVYAGGAPLSFSPWWRGSGAESSELPYLRKLTFERFPREAWEPDAVGRFVNKLGGHLVEMLQPEDSWFLSVKAWMKQPSDVPKEVVVEVPEPDLLPRAQATPPAPRSPRSKRTV